MSETKYSIGQAAKICKIPIQTLRYYDSIRLLVPSFRNESSHYRYYSADDLVSAFIIRQFRLMGLGIKDIKKIVEEKSTEELLKIVHVQLYNMESEMEKLQKTCNEIRCFEQRIRKGTEFLQLEHDKQTRGKGHIQLEDIDTIYLYSERKYMRHYHNEEVNLDCWIDINEQVRNHLFQVTGPVFATFHTEFMGQFLSSDCDVEFSIQVAPTEAPQSSLQLFGGFKAATAIHAGAYDSIFKTYIALKRWIEESHYKVVGPVTEEFLISPIDINNAENLVTRVIIPVQ